MKIVIMRHGKPSFDLEAIKSKRISSAHLGEIIHDYGLSTIDPSSQPSNDSRRMAEKCYFSICSDLPRAIISCELLGVGENNTVDPCFRESALPYLDWHQPRLTFFSWAIIFRLAWLLGFSRNGESCKEAKSRSKLGADKLEGYASKYESVLLLGHGIINRLLIKELRRRKWQLKKRTDEQYWSYTVLEYGV